jgi:hypothetical protein
MEKELVSPGSCPTGAECIIGPRSPKRDAFPPRK